MPATTTPGDDVKKLASLIKDIGFAMMTTAMPDHTLRSRPMATQTEAFDGEALWFFTYAESAKVHEIRDDQHVNLSYADPAKNNYVSVSGRATVTRDTAKAKELWTPALKAWFPQGLDDPNLALIRVQVDQAEYWDSPNSKMVQLGGFIKAVVTGKRAEGGENKKVDLHRA